MGVTKTILKEGAGPSPKKGDTVQMHYTGKLKDGTVFDSSHKRNKPFSFTLGVGQVIQGWDDGVIQMKVGEKALLQITSDYGYGSRGAGGVIPPYADLDFEVEFLAIM